MKMPAGPIFARFNSGSLVERFPKSVQVLGGVVGDFRRACCRGGHYRTYPRVANDAMTDMKWRNGFAAVFMCDILPDLPRCSSHCLFMAEFVQASAKNFHQLLDTACGQTNLIWLASRLPHIIQLSDSTSTSSTIHVITVTLLMNSPRRRHWTN